MQHSQCLGLGSWAAVLGLIHSCATREREREKTKVSMMLIQENQVIILVYTHTVF